MSTSWFQIWAPDPHLLSSFLKYPERAETIAPAMNMPRAGWNKVGHNGSHESMRVDVSNTAFSPRPANNQARINIMKKKSATRTLSMISLVPFPFGSSVLPVRSKFSTLFSSSLFFWSLAMSSSIVKFCKKSSLIGEFSPVGFSGELSSFLHNGTFFSPSSLDAAALTCHRIQRKRKSWASRYFLRRWKCKRTCPTQQLANLSAYKKRRLEIQKVFCSRELKIVVIHWTIQKDRRPSSVPFSQGTLM